METPKVTSNRQDDFPQCKQQCEKTNEALYGGFKEEHKGGVDYQRSINLSRNCECFSKVIQPFRSFGWRVVEGRGTTYLSFTLSSSNEEIAFSEKPVSKPD